MSRLPPLASIRAFEAAARHLSFTKAADELNVTQSAISRHIKQLEDYLGVELFLRQHRALALTPAGQSYCSELTGMFRRMAVATEKIVRSSRNERLHIHSYTTFAMHWLIPRLRRFQDANPEIEFELTLSSRPVDLDREQVHGVIRTGPGEFERADRLFSVSLLPVCAPSLHHLFAGPDPEKGFMAVPLLHSIAAAQNWPIWAECVGNRELDLARGFRLESSAMAYLAAEKGLGVTLAQYEFVESAIAAGTFRIAVPKIVYAARAHYFARLPRYHGFRPLTIFREWLLTEVEMARAGDAGRLPAGVFAFDQDATQGR